MKMQKLRRLCALLLAAVTSLTAVQMTAPPVEAAESRPTSGNYVRFVNKVDDQDYPRTTSILEGERINTVYQMPNGYTIANPPFTAVGQSASSSSSGGETVDELNKYFTSDNDGKQSYIEAVDNTEIHGKLENNGGRKSITLNPIFQAYLSQSTMGTLVVKNPGGENDTYSLSGVVAGEKDIAILETSTISFTVTKADYDTTGKLTSIAFSKISAPKGGLSDYNGGDVIAQVITSNNVMTVEISKQGGNDRQPISLDLTIQSFSGTITVDSVFSLTFMKEEANQLVLEILTRQKAAELSASYIQSHFSDYVKLSDSDIRMNSNNGSIDDSDVSKIISGKFTLSSVDRRFNYNNFQIQWKWTPDPGYEKPIPTIQLQQNTTTGRWDANVQLAEETVKGTLSADVTCKGYTLSNAIKFSITVLGKGTPPSFKSAYRYTGMGYGNQPSIVYGAFPDTMDVYDGTLKDWELPEKPFKFSAVLDFGSGVNQAAQIKIDVKNGGRGAVDIYLGNSTTKYVPGTMIPYRNNGKEDVMVQAAEAGNVTLEITYYNSDGNTFNRSPYRVNLPIIDTSPSEDGRLKSVQIKAVPDGTAPPEQLERFQQAYPNGVVDYSFDKDTGQYDITLPNIVKEVTLSPAYFYTSAHGVKPVSVSWRGGSVNGEVELSMQDASTRVTPPIPLEESTPMQVILLGTAEDGVNTAVYIFNITRLSKSDNAYLESLSVITKDDKVERIDQNIDLTMQFNFSIELEYGYFGEKKAKITATTEDPWAVKPEITPTSQDVLSRIAKFFNSNSVAVDLIYDKNDETGEVKNVNTFRISVTSESGQSVVNYYVTITILDPSENNQLSQLDVYRADAVNKEQLLFDNKQQFDKNGRDFYLTIPYSTEKLRFVMLPDDEKALAVRYGLAETELKEVPYKKKGTPLETTVDVKASDPIKEKEKTYTFEFGVRAEDKNWTPVSYLLHITRADPDTDARLTSMTVTDEETGTAVENFAFNAQKMEYAFEVPFTTTSVVVSPVAYSKLSKVTVNDAKISEQFPGKSIALKAGQVTTVTVRVVPEGGEGYAQNYVLQITRRAPSNEARLLNLVVTGAENMQPEKFQPAHTSYTVDVPEGTENFTVTPTPVDPMATITVNGKPVAGGTASGPIVTTKGNETVKIVVTAEDGKTTKTYNLNVRNYNYITKSSDATLSSLYVNYGDLSPRFRSNIEEYELYVKSTAMSLELKPQRSNSRATMKVYGDSRQLTEYDGTYSASLLSDKTEFSIDVTAEDGTQKTYVLNVYRNNKKKQGSLKPITSDMVNYLEDPIVIDITNYAVVDASAFNTLKTDYPEKTILFQGNDYTLQIKGSDISGLVPHTSTFDLFFSFTTPDENLIQQAIWDIDSDSVQDLEDLEPVYLHFDDHGALPGKMLLTVNLGREYSNDQLFWNYYNAERDRIDYYGYVKSNAKGGFTVPITHLSTYFVTKQKIVGAENKVSVNYGGVSSGSDMTNLDTNVGQGEGIGGDGTQGKDNPKTGVPDKTE